MKEPIMERSIEHKKNVLFDSVKERLEDGTMPYTLKNTVLDYIRVNEYAKTRAMIYMQDYTQKDVWIDRYESAADKIYAKINEMTLEEGKSIHSVRIAMLGIDEDNNQVPGSERDWIYQIQK